MMDNENLHYDPQGVGYSNHTLTNGSPIRGSYTVKDGTESVMGIAFRKREQLSSIVFPEGLLSIGDASFSHCKALKKITIPASIEHIGVAAFCKSGLEEVTFLGAPKVIDHKAFYGCDKLKRIIVPKCKKQYFEELFGSNYTFIIIESGQTKQTTPQYEPQAGKTIYQIDLFGNKTRVGIKEPELFAAPQPKKEKEVNNTPATTQQTTDLFGEPIIKRAYLEYNKMVFNWAADDDVLLSDLFSGPTFLKGDPSYQFRRKALFVFMTSKTEKRTNILKSTEYALAANTSFFKQKYDEKYGHFRTPVRIFIFVCDDNAKAKFYDEVNLQRIASNTIIVKSLIMSFS